MIGHRPALWLPAMNVRDEAMTREPGLVRLRAIGAVGEDAGREDVGPHEVFQLRAVVAGGVRHLEGA